jgi:DNA-binding response OmpR family regulator
VRHGECCNRSELLHDVWHMAPDTTTNIVDVYINYLRKKLAAAVPDGETGAVVIETVRGSGYRLSAESESTAVPQPLSADTAVA